MSTVAIVPARGGSKGIPRKNLRVVAGRTLVGWAVHAGLEAATVTDVVVSSDDPEILEEGRRQGALPLLRPSALATDSASTDAVLLHALGALGWRHEIVVLLQPTVPARRPGLVDECVQRLIATGSDSLLTGRRLGFVWRRHGLAIRRPRAGRWEQTNCRERARRQDFRIEDRRFEEDGAVFVSRSSLLADTGCRLGGKVELFENRRTVDVDDFDDLEFAEYLLTRCGKLFSETA